MMKPEIYCVQVYVYVFLHWVTLCIRIFLQEPRVVLHPLGNQIFTLDMYMCIMYVFLHWVTLCIMIFFHWPCTVLNPFENQISSVCMCMFMYFEWLGASYHHISHAALHSFTSGLYSWSDTSTPLTLMLLVTNFANTKWCKKNLKITETLAYGYSSEVIPWGLSNEYQHDRV